MVLNTNWSLWLRLSAISVSSLVLGCSGGPAAIPPLHVDAASAAEQAFQLHDTNQDGLIDEAELAASPGLTYAAKRADQDQDGGLSKDEVVAMIEAWNAQAIGLVTLRCNVKLGRKPLAGAVVRFEPEPFLEGAVEVATGVTDEFGDAFVSIPKEKRPIADSPPGVQLGLYRVVITKEKGGKQMVSAKYNESTTLGQEVAFEDPGVQNGIRYTLKK